MMNSSRNSLDLLLRKIAAAAQQDPGTQALYAAANMAKPPGAPPMPKPIDKGDPAADALAKEKEEEATRKAESDHKKEIDVKDKEIASLRQDVQKANLEAQKLRSSLELTKQRHADLDKIRAEQNKLESKRMGLAKEEAEHKVRLGEETANARAMQAEDRAKSLEALANDRIKNMEQITGDKVKSLEQLASQRAKNVEQSAMENAKAYVKMTEEARKANEQAVAGTRDDIYKRQNDLLKDKESFLASKEKALKGGGNTSPYLMKSLQDAASAARNIAKLQGKLAGDVFAKAAAGEPQQYSNFNNPPSGTQQATPGQGQQAAQRPAPQQQQQAPQQQAPQQQAPQQQQQRPASPAPQQQQQQAPQQQQQPRYSNGLSTNADGSWNMQAAIARRRENERKQVLFNKFGDPSKMNAADLRKAMAQARNAAFSMRTYGSADGRRDENGNIIAVKDIKDEQVRGNNYDAQQYDDYYKHLQDAYNKRMSQISSAPKGSAEAIEYANAKAMDYRRSGVFGLDEEQSEAEKIENEAMDANSDKPKSWTEHTGRWYNPARWAAEVGDFVIGNPLRMINDGAKDYKETHDLAGMYGNKLNMFGSNSYASDASRKAFEDKAKEQGVSSTAWGSAGRLAGTAGLAALDLAGTAAMVVPGMQGVGAGVKAVTLGSRAARLANAASKAHRFRVGWRASRIANKANKATGYANSNALMRGVHKMNDFMYGNLKRTAVSLPALITAHHFMPDRDKQMSAYAQQAADEYASGGMGKTAAARRSFIVKQAVDNVYIPGKGMQPVDQSAAQHKRDERYGDRGNDHTSSFMNHGYSSLNYNRGANMLATGQGGAGTFRSIMGMVGGFLPKQFFDASKLNGTVALPGAYDPNQQNKWNTLVASSMMDMNPYRDATLMRPAMPGSGASSNVARSMQDAKDQSVAQQSYYA